MRREPVTQVTALAPVGVVNWPESAIALDKPRSEAPTYSPVGLAAAMIGLGIWGERWF
jgi:hypothetical protein